MKLGVMSSGIAALGWERALAYCQELGLDAIGLACGAYAKTRLIDPEAVLADAAAQQKLLDDVARHGLVLSALSCHGNAVHPDPDEARRHERVLCHCTPRLERAERLGDRLPRETHEVGLRVEQIHMARPAGHEEENDALRLRGEMRLLRCERTR